DLSYTLVAENLSRAAAHHVTVHVPIHDRAFHATFVRATPEPDDNEPVLVWKLGTLKGLEKKTIRLVVKPTGAGDVTCCARVEYEGVAKKADNLVIKGVVRAEGGVRQEAVHRVKVVQAGLALVKAGPKEALVGRLTTYRLTVSNPGTLPATRVTLIDELPAEI